MTAIRRSAVRSFAEAELSYDVPAAEAVGAFPATAWKACADFGIQGLPVPAAYGGRGAGPVLIAEVLEELGACCRDSGLLFALGAQLWACELPLVLFGTAEQRALPPGLCNGDLIGGQAMSEPDAGSDALALRTTAKWRDGAFRLDGRKTWVTNGPVADVLVVFARTDPELSFAGISAFLVDTAASGVTLGAPMAKMGLRTAQMGEVELADCRVPSDALLGPRGAGMAVFHRSMEWERSFILAGAVGAMGRQLRECVEFVRSRRSSGRPLEEFQAVSHRLAEMRVRLETSRLVLREIAVLKESGVHDGARAALAKLHLSESFLRSSSDALALMGARGYLHGSEAERTMRDAHAARTYSGTSDIQRTLIAGDLLS